MPERETIVTKAVLRSWPLPHPDDDAGKDSRGHVLVIGGAADTPGAVLLAGESALRVGAGKITIATVAGNAPALAVAVPESAVTALPATTAGSISADAVEVLTAGATSADVVLLGPGMRDPDETRELVAGLLGAIDDETLVVLDSMALTCGGLNADGAAALTGRVVVTPNSTEAKRLLDGAAIDEDAAPALARRLPAVVTLGARVAAPDGRVWVDDSGHSGLGTSGSGDVLAGAIAGLLARGADVEQAAVWGRHLHAEAGERLVAETGALGFLARDLLDQLPLVLAQLER